MIYYAFARSHNAQVLNFGAQCCCVAYGSCGYRVVAQKRFVYLSWFYAGSMAEDCIGPSVVFGTAVCENSSAVAGLGM